MPITIEKLRALKKTADEASTAFREFKPNGTVEQDIEERRLLKVSSEARTAYADALDAYEAQQESAA